MKTDVLKVSDLFPVHANPSLLEGRETVPPEVVMKVARFVLDFDNVHDDSRHLHGEVLSQAIENYTDDLLSKIENMKKTLDDMDYHEGRHYRPRVGKAVLALAEDCKSLYRFCESDAYATRETPLELRRVFAHYRSEMKTTLPRILNRIEIADQAYDIQMMSRFVRY